MGDAPIKDQLAGTLDETVDVLRECTERNYFDADDLIARLAIVRGRAQRAAIVVHLAEAFVQVACAPGTDPGLAVMGNDLMKACRSARGITTVREHYEAMAREAQAAAA